MGEDNQTDAKAKDVDSSELVLNMEGMIKNLMSTLDKQTEEVTKFQDALNDIFENDETYTNHAKLAKEAARVKSNTKQQILKQPQAADLNNKVKTLKSEIAENHASLSDYLREFQRMSGISEIEGDDGELREIVYTAKLVRKSSKFGG
jgi:predicted RNase H-like nuclease (RuvC/YqgF family)